MIQYTYPNAVRILYTPLFSRNYLSMEKSQDYTSKPGNVVFRGTRSEALEFFRDLYPSKSIVFQGDYKRAY